MKACYPYFTEMLESSSLAQFSFRQHVDISKVQKRRHL